MTTIPDSLKLLFETTIREQDESYVISIPKELLEEQSLSLQDPYRVALFPTAQEPSPETVSESPQKTSKINTEHARVNNGKTGKETQSVNRRPVQPPVEPGDIRSVTIDSLGDKGDGIAKVDRGFVVIVPGTQPGDQLNVEINNVTENVAFAEPVSEPTVR